MKTLFAPLFAALMIALPFAGAASAAQSSSSLTLVNVTAPGAPPSYGQTVTFLAQTSASDPFVLLKCWQNTVLVLAADTADGQPDVTLASEAWTGGAANCTAALYEFTNGAHTKTLATLNFAVTA